MKAISLLSLGVPFCALRESRKRVFQAPQAESLKNATPLIKWNRRK
jgi:hypothetical protein